MANLAWVFYRFMFEFEITLSMAVMMAGRSLPYGNMLYTIISLSIFTGIFIISYFIDIFAWQKSLRYNLSPYVIYIIIFSGIIGRNYTGELEMTWESIAILITFTIVFIGFFVKLVKIFRRLSYLLNYRKFPHRKNFTV